MTKENGLSKTEEKNVAEYIESITTGRVHDEHCRHLFANFISNHNNALYSCKCWCHQPKHNHPYDPSCVICRDMLAKDQAKNQSPGQKYAEFVNKQILDEIVRKTPI